MADVGREWVGKFEAWRASAEPDAIAPDGSEVRVLAGLERGGMAEFRLGAGQVSRAVAHRTVEELWYVVAGTGEMWRRSEDGLEEVTRLERGVSIAIPLRTVFQFRADAEAPLVVIGVTIPPWPGDGEALEREGRWAPTT